MPVGYRNSAGVDFDDLFDPDVQGDGPTAPFLRTAAGVAVRYADISYGSKGPNVGYRTSAGVDVSNLWAAKGTASYVIAGLDGKSLYAVDQALSAQQTVSAQVAVSLQSNGSWAVSGGTSNGPVGQPPPSSGTWTGAGRTGADYDVRLRVTSSGHASRVVTNTASSYTRMSSGAVSAGLSITASGISGETRSASFEVLIDVRDRASGAVVTTRVIGTVSVSGFV